LIPFFRAFVLGVYEYLALTFVLVLFFFCNVSGLLTVSDDVVNIRKDLLTMERSVKLFQLGFSSTDA